VSPGGLVLPRVSARPRVRLARPSRYEFVLAHCARSVRSRGYAGEMSAAVPGSQGKSLDDIRKALDVEDFKRQFCGNDELRALAFKVGFVEPATERTYQEAKLADEG